MIFLLRFLAGALLAGAAASPPWKSVVTAAALWMCATVTIYLVNGVSDVIEDSANKSSRPIASGALAPRTAAAVAAVAAVVAAAGAVLSGNLWAVLLTVAMLGLGYAYSNGPMPLKRSMSGFLSTVTIGGLLTYLAGWNSTGTAAMAADLVFFAGAMSLWMAFGGATKDLSDIDGDHLAGRRTWPVVLGERRARRAMAGTALATGAGFGVAALLVVPGLRLPAATLLVGSVLLAVTATSQRSGGARNARRRPYRIFMVTQYAAHLALLTQFTL